ncbi:hypothetical protein [Allorhodopirellula heiligendammensis]|uniref:Uncharacterized protein n=1 Tax=Allorhodopirellula heiligendammensis TaxID=2714739 RepID=A0A5C6BV86_9BACT|nr:hypothetical protein [Allorhodopirellula heiligendammensis]TWU15955.1 hypothetical protein Poly21_31590 [Allorhodopirellula heiligendammensis]
MMIDAIQSIAGYDSMTPAQIADALAEIVLRAESFETFNSLTLSLDNDVMLVETMVAAMRLAGLNASADSLTTRGIDFGLPAVQSMVDVLATSAPETFTAPIVATLKSLGQQTRWASHGGTGEPPTAQAVTDAMAENAASLRESSRLAALNDAIDAVRVSVNLSDESLTIAELQSAVNDALANGWSE